MYMYMYMYEGVLLLCFSCTAGSWTSVSRTGPAPNGSFLGPHAQLGLKDRQLSASELAQERERQDEILGTAPQNTVSGPFPLGYASGLKGRTFKTSLSRPYLQDLTIKTLLSGPYFNILRGPLLCFL